MERIADKPAFPCESYTDDFGKKAPRSNIYSGLTIRQHFAGMIAQGMAANPEVAKTGMSPDVWVRGCVNIADALIAELEKTNTPAS